jgi:hypothetical protein
MWRAGLTIRSPFVFLDHGSHSALFCAPDQVPALPLSAPLSLAYYLCSDTVAYQ